MRAKAVVDGQQVEIPVLHFDRTAGTRQQVATGDGSPGKAEELADGKTAAESETVRRPNRSREAQGAAVEKSRYRSGCTRTVNRHRWIGRGDQGRRKKHC